MKEKVEILKNAIYKSSVGILRIIIPIISIPYIYRIFSPELMGKIEFSQSISSYFGVFCGVGIYSYGIREISQLKNNSNNRNKAFTELFLISIISGMFTIIAYCIYIYIQFKNENIMKYFLLINSINLISIMIYTEWVNEALENFKFISMKTFIVKIINLICIFLFVRENTDYYTYLFIVNFFIFLNNFISFIFIKKYIKFDFNNINLKKYIVPLLVTFFIVDGNILVLNIDKIILGFFSKNIEDVAYYGVSLKIINLVMIFSLSLIGGATPRLALYVKENKKEEYEKIFNFVFSCNCLLIYPIVVGIFILSKNILYIFGGEKYIVAEWILRLATIHLLFISLSNILINQILFLNKKEKVVAYNLSIVLIINFLLKYILIKFDIVNSKIILIGTIFVDVILFILNYVYIEKKLDYKLEIFKIENQKYFIISLNFFLIKYVLSLMKLNYTLEMILVIILSVIVYITILYIIKDKNIEYMFKFINRKREN